MKKKRIILFEDFDLDKFMEDPESGFHDDSKKEIEEGDWVNSYRGPGQLLSVRNGIAKVQLISASSSIVSVPMTALEKITKEEALKIRRDLPDTKKEVARMTSEMESIVKASVEEDEDSGQEIFVGNIEKVMSYLEDFLVDLIDLKNKDPYAPYYSEYGVFTSHLANLCYLMLDYVGKSMESTDDMSELAKLKKYQLRIEKIQDKFFEISE